MPNAKDLYKELTPAPKPKGKLTPGAQTLYSMQSEAVRNTIATRGKDGGKRSNNERTEYSKADQEMLARIDAVVNPRPDPIKFGKDEYQDALKRGYSNNDINDFLKMPGLEVDTKYMGFQAAGLGTGPDGKQYLQWRVDEQYGKPKAAPAAPTPTPVTSTVTNITQEIVKTEAGTAGITTLGAVPVVPEDPKVTAPAPILGNPLGDQSQRVQRETAKRTLTSV